MPPVFVFSVNKDYQKRYEMAADMFSDLKLGMDVVIKADRGCSGEGPQVAMHRNCHIF